ncbi:hypothetical protein KIM372_02300 [Bombiscardovia nodaiensis]|uniref:Uncharacterized protein n=1 Tax=Bombiscardovia nodaiensis TaxID=2932181 RepID=A0ABM8B6J1_9BIFI|nr:hypothetical protein KIM372_02300 [Bombiscardovia nodaiensis]
MRTMRVLRTLRAIGVAIVIIAANSLAAPSAHAAGLTRGSCTPYYSTYAQCFPDPALAAYMAAERGDSVNSGYVLPFCATDPGSGGCGLDIENKGVRSLEGIDNIPKLGVIWGSGNKIVNLSGAHSDTLYELNLGSNEINDISDLNVGNFPNLREINLANNHIKDISPLTSMFRNPPDLLNGFGVIAYGQTITLPDIPAPTTGLPYTLGPVYGVHQDRVSTGYLPSSEGTFRSNSISGSPSGGRNNWNGEWAWDNPLPGNYTFSFSQNPYRDNPYGANHPAIEINYSGTIKQKLTGLIAQFDSNGGTPVPSASVQPGGLIPRPRTDPTKGDSRFDGWYTAATGGSLWDFPNTRIYANTTLYAHWTDPFKVTFNPQNGQAATVKTVRPGSAIAALSPQPTLSGKGFAGWYTQPTGGSPWDFTKPVTGDMTLYGHWADFMTMPTSGSEPLQQGIGILAVALSCIGGLALLTYKRLTRSK